MAIDIGPGILVGFGICIGEGCEVIPPALVSIIITENDDPLVTENGYYLTTE